MRAAAADNTPTENVPPNRQWAGMPRWYHSIFFRVVLLCGVLLFCLMGSVIAVLHFFFNEAAQEMQDEAQRVSESIVVQFEQDPEKEMAELSEDALALYPGAQVEITPFHDNPGAPAFPRGAQADSKSSVYVEHVNGQLTRVAHVLLPLGEKEVMMTLRVPIVPQVEIFRAFKNRYLFTLTALFVFALGLMIYVIAFSLRPLTVLSETCTAISAGDLRSVSTVGASGEILALERTFNQMVKSLKDKELMEDKLRQAQRLSALGNLAAGIAHDIRNPLNAIKLLSSHAIDTLDPDTGAPAAKSLQTIRREVDRLEEIVSSFLSLAREREIAPEACQVEDLLRECLGLFSKEAEARGIRLISELRAGSVELMLDPKNFTRAVLNVLMNALEACPPGGRVRLFSRRNGERLEIEVRDDGPGMDKATLDRIFDPYYTTKAGGTGLGLSITRGIIAEHGGTIELTSSPGQGCQVLISLPIDSPKDARIV